MVGWGGGVGTVCKQSLQINITILVYNNDENWVSHILFLRIGVILVYNNDEKLGQSHTFS